MAQNLQNHHVSMCAKRKFLSILTLKKVITEKLFFGQLNYQIADKLLFFLQIYC